MKEIEYQDFSLGIHNKAIRVPVDATLELTYRCNHRCVHCFCNLPASDKKASQEELKTGEIKEILDELASMGCLWLLITGGEPLLMPDFEEIYIHAKRKGLLITLFTNGTLLDEGTINLLSRYPPFVVEISIYGATKETYERVTRIEGSYERCIRGIKKIADTNIRLKLKTMALTINQHEIEAMDRMAQELGCEFRFDPIIQKRIDNNRFSEPEKYRISPEDVVRLDRMFPKRMEAYSEFCEKFIFKPVRIGRLYQCGAGESSININPYGVAMACSMMLRDSFSIKEHGLRWIWDAGIPSVTNQKKDFRLPCDDCHLVNLCGQCAPWSILENGDVKREVTYLCRIAKIRERDFEFIVHPSEEVSHEKAMVKT